MEQGQQVPHFGGRTVTRPAYQGGSLERPIGSHAEYGPREAWVAALDRVETASTNGAAALGQLRWGLDYIDRAYGTRRSRAKRHLRRAWSELRAAAAEYRR